MVNPLETKKVYLFFDKVIIVNLYLFSLGTMVSKALTSISGALVIIFWILRIISTKGYSFKTTPLDRPILFLIIAILLSGIGSFTMEYGDATLKYIGLILFYYAIVNTIKNDKTVKIMALLTLCSMIIASLYGLYQYFFLGAHRVGGFIMIIGYGGLLSFIIIFLLIFLLWSDISLKYKLASSVMVILFGLNLLFTKSRGAWLAFITGGAVLSWLKDKRLILVLLFFLVLLAIFLPNEYILRFKSSFDLTENRSNLGRIIVWQGACLMWKDNPVNGVGMGNFKQTFETKYMHLQPITTEHAHNNFLQFAAETGTIGFIAFFYFMFMVLRILYKSYCVSKNNVWNLFILSAFISMVVFNALGLTDLVFWTAPVVRFFWFLLALSIVVIDFNQNQGKDSIQN